jgi:hypothetical protein
VRSTAKQAILSLYSYIIFDCDDLPLQSTMQDISKISTFNHFSNKLHDRSFSLFQTYKKSLTYWGQKQNAISLIHQSWVGTLKHA